ncbi:hypothetical protein VYU27_005797 [Nannochloropsis oceanica]
MERKWWDATALDIDRRRRRILLSVDGRPSLSRWVEIDGREIADISTHVKPITGGTLAPPPPPPLLPPPPLSHPLLAGVGAAIDPAAGVAGGGVLVPLRGGKEPVPATPRQIRAREAANARDLPTLLSFINVQDPAALRMTYYRRKLHLITAYSPEAPSRGVGCPLLTARREQGAPELNVHHHNHHHKRGYVKRAKIDRRGSTMSSRRGKSGHSSALTMGYAERREWVLSHVVTELNEDLFTDLLLDYW